MCSRINGLAADRRSGTIFLTSARRHHLHPTHLNQTFAAVAVLVYELALQHVGHRLLAAMGVVPEAGSDAVAFEVV